MLEDTRCAKLIKVTTAYLREIYEAEQQELISLMQQDEEESRQWVEKALNQSQNKILNVEEYLNSKRHYRWQPN